MCSLPIKDVEIIAEIEVPKRKTKWTATLLALKALRVGHVFTCQLETPLHYESVRGVLYQGARRLGFEIRIHRDNLKLYIKKVSG